MGGREGQRDGGTDGEKEKERERGHGAVIGDVLCFESEATCGRNIFFFVITEHPTESQ